MADISRQTPREVVTPGTEVRRDEPQFVPDRTLPQLLGEMTTEIGDVFRKEIELAKVEAREEIRSAAKGAAMLGAAGYAGHLALVLLSVAAAWGLGYLVGVALGFVIVAVVWAIAATILGLSGREKLKAAAPVTPQTVETVKEDVQWAREQMK